jgi:alpha-1,2-mannosyltransferase
MRIVILLHRFLNPKRLAYAWITGGILWISWLISILLGSDKKDLYGQLIGADLLAFYTGGKILLQGQSVQLYDLSFQQTLQQELVGSDWTDIEAFVNPPFYAWLSVPFAKLPYLLSFAIWALFGLLGLWISLRLLDAKDPRRSFIWSLTWFPIFATVSFGQNSLLSLTLFSLTYWLWCRERLWAAGLVSSLLLFKPQWVIGVGLFWLLEWRRNMPALLGLILGGGILALLCFWQLPDASWAYINLTNKILPSWQTQSGYQLYHLHTVRGFWLLLLPQHHAWADRLSLLFATIGLLSFVRFWRQHRNQQVLLFAGVICLTLWINPHAMIYDWTVLLIPAVLLWQQVPNLREGWKVLYALIWLVTLVGSPLTRAQLQWLPFTIQISIPVFLLVIYVTYRWLRDPPELDLTLEETVHG